MKHLIKQYAHFFGEIIRPDPEYSGPNFLNCFYHLIDLTQFKLFMEFPYSSKSQQKSDSCWLFFASNS